MTARTRAYLLLLLAGAIWGVAGPVIKDTLDYFPPTLFLTYRFFISVVIAFPLLFKFHPHVTRTLSHLSPADWILLIVCGIMGTSVQLGLLFIGFSLTSSVEGTLISSTSPLMVALASHWLLKEHISKRQKIGLVLGLAGSQIIVLGPLLKGGGLDMSNLTGNLFVLLANLAWVAYAILSKKMTKLNLSPWLITCVSFFFGFLSMLFVLITTSFPETILFSLTNAPLTAHISVLYMALVSGLIAYWLYQVSQKTLGVSQANFIHYLPPLFATPIGHLWLNEPISQSFIVGSIITTMGVVIAEVKFRHHSH